MNEMREIIEIASSVPLLYLCLEPLNRVQTLKMLKHPHLQMLLQGSEKEAEVELGDLSLDGPVRVIHMICLFHH